MRCSEWIILEVGPKFARSSMIWYCSLRFNGDVTVIFLICFCLFFCWYIWYQVLRWQNWTDCYDGLNCSGSMIKLMINYVSYSYSSTSGSFFREGNDWDRYILVINIIVIIEIRFTGFYFLFLHNFSTLRHTHFI